MTDSTEIPVDALRNGDRFVDADGRHHWTAVSDAGLIVTGSGPVVRVVVQFADGGHSERFWDPGTMIAVERAKDILLTRSGELGVTQVTGNTEKGIAFVDAWTQTDPDFYVHDAGVIIVKNGDVAAVEQGAMTEGLTVDYDLIASERPGT